MSAEGFEALRLSIWGAHRLFGGRARYAVCVNTVGVDEARARTGHVPPDVQWRDATDSLPPGIRRYLDEGLTEGTAWKLAPLRCFPECHELSLDNDCILWSVPRALGAWLGDPAERSCLVAEDVRACLGRFSGRCQDRPRNLGIRGLPPGFDLGRALEAVITEADRPLTSELDEQGWQLAALGTSPEVHVVSLDEVSICSPFWPHRPSPGICGAHFVGLNAHRLPWAYEGRPASELTREHWRRLKPALHAKVGLPPPHDGGGSA